MSEIRGYIQNGSEHSRFSVYPWDEWLDGKPHILTIGKDFSAVHVLRSAAYRMGTKRGRSIRIHRINLNEVVVQDITREDGVMEAVITFQVQDMDTANELFARALQLEVGEAGSPVIRVIKIEVNK